MEREVEPRLSMPQPVPRRGDGLVAPFLLLALPFGETPSPESLKSIRLGVAPPSPRRQLQEKEGTQASQCYLHQPPSHSHPSRCYEKFPEVGPEAPQAGSLSPGSAMGRRISACALK